MTSENIFDSPRLQRLWRFVLEEIPAEHGLLVLSDGQGRTLLRLTHGLDGNGGAESRLKFIRRATDDGQPVFLVRPPVEHFLKEDGRVGFHETGSVLCVPVAFSDRPVGALYLDRAPRDDPFAQEDADFLLSLSGSILDSLCPAIKKAMLAAAGPVAGFEDDPGRRIIGRSEAIVRLKGLIRKVKGSDAAVFITGESGTGKELVARAVHDSGPRAGRPFVVINCSAIPDTLLESELFGHVRGAFTGAVQERPGLIEEADTGTFFLDEVGDLSPLLQAKLLRVLQEKEVRRLGANRGRRVEVRFISATNKNIESEVGRGRFREDLYYRLRLIPVHIPPLRARRDDLLPLVNHCLEVRCRDMKRERAFFAPEALEMLFAYSWPGNVRELQNEVQRCLIFSDENSRFIPAECLSETINPRGRDAPAASHRYFEARAEFEKDFLNRALALYDFNRSRTAMEVGLSRQGLFKLLKKHKIEARNCQS